MAVLIKLLKLPLLLLPKPLHLLLKLLHLLLPKLLKPLLLLLKLLHLLPKPLLLKLLNNILLNIKKSRIPLRILLFYIPHTPLPDFSA